MKKLARHLASMASALLIASCDGGGRGGGGETPPTGGGSVGGASEIVPVTPAPTAENYDVDAAGIPRFVLFDYIDLDKISRISKFRSGIGHSYADDFESCRSMKHYYMPKSGLDWATVDVYSPVTGTIATIFQEWAGYQLHIQSQDYPAFFVILFHVNLREPLAVGDSVAVGQHLGTHVGAQTMSDVAVRVSTPSGMKYVSYLDIATDAVFAAYQARGLAARADAIIPQAARDADPLECSGEAFGTTGTIENWVLLGG